jgi:hypothetical protein
MADIDNAVTALHKMLLADSDAENFICTDVDGARRDLSSGGYYVASKPEGSLHRINAGYPPDEVAELGFEGVRRFRGYDPIEFLVTEAEHARMLGDGVIDALEG